MNPAEPQNSEAIEVQAAALLAQRDAGWSAADAGEFALWRAADPRHEAAVVRLEHAQNLLKRLPESPAAAAMAEEIDELFRAAPRRSRFTPWLTAAGTLAAAAGLALAAWTLTPQTPPPAVLSIATAAGQPRTVPLTDGSTLLLNGGSAVEVEFVASERRISLRRGEVHFSVAKDEARPFVVSAGTIKVRAVGTAFNVRRARAAVEVIVTEGKVRVTRDDAAKEAPLFLLAGEGTLIGTAVAPLPAANRLPPAALQEKLAWHAPRLEFSETPLAEAVARFNRYSRVQLEIGDPELASWPVGGTFNADNGETFVNFLRQSGTIQVERISETRMVLRKAR